MQSDAWTFRKNSRDYDLVRLSRQLPDQPPPGKVRVQLKNVSLNYRDLVAWQNLANRNVQGRVPCSDGAGAVISVADDVKDWTLGDRVAGCFFQTWLSGPFDMVHHKNDLGGTLDGMLQTYIDLPASGLVRIPDSMTFQQAATLPCAALTAWYSLVVRGGLRSDQTILCIGTGGVSLFAMQIASAMGAHAIVLSSQDSKRERAKELGAWQTINYRSHPDWSQQVLEMTDGKGVDHVVEVGGPGTLEQSMKSVAAGGHIALIGVLTGFGAPSTSLFPLLAKNITLNGIYVGSRADFCEMNRFLDKHRIEPIIDRGFPFEGSPQAFEYLRSAQHFGKVVIDVSPT
jgi:NADPH:quinone reductase-like Zn-dependent oxidoreductase